MHPNSNASTPASRIGASNFSANSVTALPEVSSRSTNSTKPGQAVAVSETLRLISIDAPATAFSYAPEAIVPTVPITATQLFSVALTRARAPGSTTPITGTESELCNSSNATDAAVLHATTIILTSKSFTKLFAISRAKLRTSLADLLPYG